MGKVFISYRRDDTQEEVRKLFRDLKESLRQHSIFLDEGGGLLPADRWEERLANEIVGADVFLAVIGRRWADATDATGRPRLKDPDDVVRREIEWFLTNHADHGHILPVMVDTKRMPPKSRLPASLHPLLGRQACRLSSSTWDRDVRELASRIEGLVAESEEQIGAILREAEKAGGNGAVISVSPGAAGASFEDMPICGKWVARITSSTAPHPLLGPAGRLTLLLNLTGDYTFTGTAKMHRRGFRKVFGSRRFRLDGTWALGIWDGGGLLLKLNAVVDRTRDWYMNMPIAERRGRGYFAKDSEGTTYWLESRGGKTAGF